MPPRGRGGKFSKPSRGGGKHYSRNLQPLDQDGNPVGMWRDPEDVASSEEEEESEEESSDDEPGPSTTSLGQEMTRDQRKAAMKAEKDAALAKKRQTAAAPGDLPPSDDEEDSEDDEADMPANPNHTAKSRSQAAKGPAVENGTTAAADPKSRDKSQLSRRERETLQSQQARERYLKLHAEGKTDEARADLARLAIVKERREAEKARKEAEKEERAEREREREEMQERERKRREAALGPGTKKKVVAGGKK